jgi:hypothetical protein
MKSFKNYLIEQAEPTEAMPKTLENHLWHLSSPMLGDDMGYKVHESTIHYFGLTEEAKEKTAKHPNEIIKNGQAAEEKIASGFQGHAPSIRARVKAGFHAAMPEGEHPDVTKAKAKESQAHFRNFMHKEGGHAEHNKLDLLSQNGKTASSSGAGRNTVGLSLAPHTTGTATSDQNNHTGAKVKGHFDTCPSASSECRKNCLGLTAGGNRQYPENSLRAKVLRQRYLTEHPEHTARLLSHEIGQNEKWSSENNSIHDKHTNEILGHKNIKTGKVESSAPKKLSHGDLADKLKKGDAHEKPIESGVRLNVTSDLQHHNLHPASFFERHHKTKFYDYTKNTGSTHDEMPKNYTVGLSHTGDDHAESNSSAVINHLKKGGISAMVYQRGKDNVKPTRVKVHGSKEGEHEWKVVDGDSDDNLDQRHTAAAKEEHAHAAHAEEIAKHETDPVKKASLHTTIAHHKQMASEYEQKKRGVVSGLALKGVTNDKAGKFANKVDHTGTIWLHDHGTVAQMKKKTIPIKAT